MACGKCEGNEIDDYTKENLRQLDSAIEAGKKVLDCLVQAQQQLDVIHTEGIFDRISQGIFRRIMWNPKRIDEANQTIQKAKDLLIVFRRELRYIEVSSQLKIEIEGFVTFADFFFDSLLADWYVQSRLKKSSEEVEDAMRQISDILEKLYAMKAEKYS